VTPPTGGRRRRALLVVLAVSAALSLLAFETLRGRPAPEAARPRLGWPVPNRGHYHRAGAGK
jgi:hypothetical protein